MMLDIEKFDNFFHLNVNVVHYFVSIVWITFPTILAGYNEKYINIFKIVIIVLQSCIKNFYYR